MTTAAATRARYREEGWWRDGRLTDDVHHWAATAPTRTAVVDGARRATYRELWGDVQRVAASLVDLGITRGDVVSTQLPNGYPCVVVHLAVELAGGIHNPLAIQFREHEIDQVTGLLGSTLVLHPGTYRDVDYGVIHASTAPGRAGRSVPVAELLERVPVSALPDASPHTPDEAAFILNTSGTVAIKGVAHNHEESMYSARTVAEIMRLGPDDTLLCAIPMSWGGGLCWGLRFALHAGACLVSMERWDAAVAADLLDREGGTFTYGPPTLARDLVALAGEWRPADPLRMICAGAPIPRQMCVDAREQLGLELVPGYGQTEHLHSALGRLDDPIELLTSTDGRALPGVELVAVDESGTECPPGIAGELLCRGPNVSLGYWNQPELTADTYHDDGWQVTRDAGWFEAGGNLHVVGRLRDLIIRGGLNVSPREVEELLLRHPDVADVAVVGEPDERYGERICAFVVPRAGTAPTVAELTAALTDAGVARYKHPERVIPVDALPLTTTGKVRHSELRERLAREHTPQSR
ncbi:MAG TPA: AMP-binding protein [Acidimicrobiia bacterium]|nr:AMP-binding protein [Acidimicrobiia bacterium]